MIASQADSGSPQAAWIPDDPVAAAVVRLVLYFDVFHHPLTRPELVRLVAPDQPERIDRAVGSLCERGVLEARDRWVFRPGRADGIGRRQVRAGNAERLWPLARLAAAFLARLPHVRGVLITGGLSKGSSAAQDDVDFMLLVAPGRVWVLKSLLQAARKSWPEPVRELFCTNYLLAEDRLLVDDRNLFTAVELATAVPMVGRDACVALLEANRWAARYVPGLDWSLRRAGAAVALPPRRLAGLAEAATAGALGDRLERASVRGWDRYWNRKYAWLDDRVRAQRFKRSEAVATNHLHDFQGYVLGEVGRRLQAVGLSEQLELARGGLAMGPD